MNEVVGRAGGMSLDGQSEVGDRASEGEAAWVWTELNNINFLL